MDDASLTEEGDEGLVGSLDEHELQGVAVERDAFERSKDGVEEGTTGN